jgi:hypothetical protein
VADAIDAAVFEAAGLDAMSLDIATEVHAADLAMLIAERDQLLEAPTTDMPGLWPNVEPAGVGIFPWDAAKAETMFLARFDELFPPPRPSSRARRIAQRCDADPGPA